MLFGTHLYMYTNTLIWTDLTLWTREFQHHRRCECQAHVSGALLSFDKLTNLVIQRCLTYLNQNRINVKLHWINVESNVMPLPETCLLHITSFLTFS